MASAKTQKIKPVYRIGFDLGGTKMLAAVIDAKNQVVGSAKTPSLGHEGSEKGLMRMARLTRQAMREAKVAPKEIVSAGFAVPAVVDSLKGVLIEAPNLGWKNVPIKVAMEKSLKVPVSLLNDVDAGTLAEYHLGAGKGAHTLMGVFPGTGIGGGCVVAGQLLQGKRLSCMEIGNIKVPGATGEPVRMEDLTSRLAIAINASREAYRGAAPHLLGLAGTDIRNIKSGAISKSAKKDPAVSAIVDDAIATLGMVVAGAVDLIGPDRIVLGGGLVEKMTDRFVKGLGKSVRKHAHVGLGKAAKVVPAALGDDAVVLGAALHSLPKETGKR